MTSTKKPTWVSNYFPGIFDVHEKGDGPFTCGKIKLDQGVQLLEAFVYAFGVVNNHTGIFQDKLSGVTIGYLGLDACQSPAKASILLADIHSGAMSIKSDGEVTNHVEAYIGGYDSETSIAMANVLSDLSIPQISYGSGSIELRDASEYPMFFRTVPDDDQQARALVALLLHFKISYVQIIYSDVSVHSEAATTFVQYAAVSSICVAQSIASEDKVSGMTREISVSLLKAMLRKPSAKVIVFFLETTSIRMLLEQVAVNVAADEFKFVGSVSWSNNMDLINDLPVFHDRVLTLGVEASDLPQFDAFLTSLDPLSVDDPWFSDYYESLCQCSLPNKPSSLFKEPCQVPGKGIVRDCPYKQDPYVLYTVNAVYSAALGIHNALVKTCGENYKGICSNFAQADDKEQLISNGIRQAEFIDATSRLFKYSPDGESSRGFNIYFVKKLVPDKLFYTTVSPQFLMY